MIIILIQLRIVADKNLHAERLEYKTTDDLARY